jgi:hypothetical protein
MQYNININQKALVSVSTELKISLDLKDATILDFMVKFIHTGQLDCEIIDGKPFYWVAYQKIIDENPLLGIADKDVIARRLERLCSAKILTKELLKKKGNKTYFAFGSNYQKLVTDTPPSDSKSGRVPTENREPLPTQNRYNHNTNISENQNQKENQKEKIEKLQKIVPQPLAGGEAQVALGLLEKFENESELESYLAFLVEFKKPTILDFDHKCFTERFQEEALSHFYNLKRKLAQNSSPPPQEANGKLVSGDGRAYKTSKFRIEDL